jgi:predicted TPR repeat methyltransferase
MLGNILFKQGLWEQAKHHLTLALAQDKDNAEILNHLGMACCHLEEWGQAEAYLNQSIKLMPYLAEAQYHLGIIKLKNGDYPTAQMHFQQATDRDPTHFGAWYNLGLLNKQQGFFLIADACFEKAQALQPDSEIIAFLRATLNQSATPTQPPEGFVEELFDHYASHYEVHMHTSLDYQVPQTLFQLFEENMVSSPHSLNIIDLGCGTGLAGELFRPAAKSLIGIDLSSRMLQVARQKNLYDDLHQANILKTLQQLSPASIDVMIAADVLGYLGVLDSLFETISRALKPGGCFVFSVESGEKSVALSAHTRFTHSRNYIEGLCQKYGLKIIAHKANNLRTEIKGIYFCVQK